MTPVTGDATAGADVLRWPLVGRFLALAARADVAAARRCSIAAAIVVLHGLVGPRDRTRQSCDGPHLGALSRAAGRRAARRRQSLLRRMSVRARARLGSPRSTRRRVLWPKRLRGKWLAHRALRRRALLPTSSSTCGHCRGRRRILVLAYFAAALAIDLVFKGATFCKHLCPIGQFNFVASTMSPLELRDSRAVDVPVLPHVGLHRRTAIAGGAAGRLVQRGCELGLYLPAKVGNIDCTFCLDCVHACPHDNIALAVRTPGLELADARRRSGIGRLTTARTSPLLAVLFVFGALLNAFAMVSPAYSVEAWLAADAWQHDPNLLCSDVYSWSGLALRHSCCSVVLPPDARTWPRPGGVDRSNRAAIRLRARAVRLLHVACALRFPFPDRRIDGRSRHAERGDRSDGFTGARRSVVAMGGDAPGRGIPDSTGMHPARHRWIARRDAPHLACATIRADRIGRPFPGPSLSPFLGPPRSGSSSSRWR